MLTRRVTVPVVDARVRESTVALLRTGAVTVVQARTPAEKEHPMGTMTTKRTRIVLAAAATGMAMFMSPSAGAQDAKSANAAKAPMELTALDYIQIQQL